MLTAAGVGVRARHSHRLFGQPGSQYDFASQDPAQAEKRREQLEEAEKRLSKNVNHKVANMLERCALQALRVFLSPAHTARSH